MGKFLETNRRQAAPVSIDIPLISNQEVWLNIALIKQYHDMPREQAEHIAINALQRLGLGGYCL